MIDNNIDITALYDDVDALANLYRDELININAVASGDLVGFTADVQYDGQVFRVYFQLPKYWGAIEYGRRPTVNSQNGVLYTAIRRWLDVKSINPTKGDRDGLAYAITKKIHQFGFFGYNVEGKHPLENAMNLARQQGLIDKITKDVTDQYGKIIRADLKDLAKL